MTIEMGRGRDRSGRVPSISRVKAFTEAAATIPPGPERDDVNFPAPMPTQFPVTMDDDADRGNGY